MERRLDGASRGVSRFLIFQINMFDIKNIQLSVQMLLSVGLNYTDFAHNYHSYKLISFRNVKINNTVFSNVKVFASVSSRAETDGY